MERGQFALLLRGELGLGNRCKVDENTSTSTTTTTIQLHVEQFIPTRLMLRSKEGA